MSDSKTTKPATKLIVGPGRLSFPHVMKPQETENGLRYNTAILLPPTYDTKPILKALEAAWFEKFGADKTKWPRGETVRTPNKVLKKAQECYRAADGSRLYGTEFDDWTVLSAATNADNPPEVVDATLAEVTDPRKVYAGRWARLSVNAYGFANKTRGVTLGLNNVQILKDDTPLAGRAPAKSEFDVYAEDMAIEGSETSDNIWD